MSAFAGAAAHVRALARVSPVLMLAVLGCECRGEVGEAPAEEVQGAEAPVHVGHIHPDEETPSPESGDMVEAGCDQGRVEDCLALAERPGADRAAAMATACRAGGRLCAQAGGDPELLAVGCRAGSRPSCEAWAAIEGGEDARRLGCAAGWLEACDTPVEGCEGTLADCVRRSREALAEGDLDTAQQLARLGCDGERTAGCVAWAEAYGERDPDAAKVALRRACFAEVREACVALVGRDDLTPMERRTAEALVQGLAP